MDLYEKFSVSLEKNIDDAVSNSIKAIMSNISSRTDAEKNKFLCNNHTEKPILSKDAYKFPSNDFILKNEASLVSSNHNVDSEVPMYNIEPNNDISNSLKNIQTANDVSIRDKDFLITENKSNKKNIFLKDVYEPVDYDNKSIKKGKSQDMYYMQDSFLSNSYKKSYEKLELKTNGDLSLSRDHFMTKSSIETNQFNDKYIESQVQDLKNEIDMLKKSKVIILKLTNRPQLKKLTNSPIKNFSLRKYSKDKDYYRTCLKTSNIEFPSKVYAQTQKSTPKQS